MLLLFLLFVSLPSPFNILHRQEASPVKEKRHYGSMAVTHAALQHESNMGESSLCPLIRLISEVEPNSYRHSVITFLEAI
jgi:hypothetical protein